MLLALAACGGRADRRAAEQVVRAYDRAVIEAHLTGATAALEAVASRDEADRVEVILGGLRARHERLLASLDRLEVKRAALHPGEGRGVAVAEERWTYHRIDARTRAPTTPVIEKRYEVTYDLLRRGGDWVVDRVRLGDAPAPARVTTPAPASAAPPAAAPAPTAAPAPAPAAAPAGGTTR